MISKWKLKAVVQKLLSFLPSPERANYWFQKNVTKGVILSDEHLGYKLLHAQDHIGYLKKWGAKSEGNTVLELGTGWYPIVPIMMYLSGISHRIISLDIQSWLTHEGFLNAIQRISEWKENGRLKQYFPELDEGRWRNLVAMATKSGGVEELKVHIGLETLIIDARHTKLPENSIDFICSNNTLEHIYREVLVDILKEFDRIIKPNGLMSHFIDMTDHFAHFDSSITVYNFLKFSHRQWSLIDNSIQPQNRMRLVQYEEIYQQLGLPISERKIWEYDVMDLKDLNIHPEFEIFSQDQLAVKHAYLISKYGE